MANLIGLPGQVLSTSFSSTSNAARPNCTMLRKIFEAGAFRLEPPQN